MTMMPPTEPQRASYSEDKATTRRELQALWRKTKEAAGIRSNRDPLPAGVAHPGTSDEVARADHIHPAGGSTAERLALWRPPSLTYTKAVNGSGLAFGTRLQLPDIDSGFVTHPSAGRLEFTEDGLYTIILTISCNGMNGFNPPTEAERWGVIYEPYWLHGPDPNTYNVYEPRQYLTMQHRVRGSSETSGLLYGQLEVTRRARPQDAVQFRWVGPDAGINSYTCTVELLIIKQS